MCTVFRGAAGLALASHVFCVQFRYRALLLPVFIVRSVCCILRCYLPADSVAYNALNVRFLMIHTALSLGVGSPPANQAQNMQRRLGTERRQGYAWGWQ